MLIAGCYDLRGGSTSEAGIRDAADAGDDTRLVPDVVNEDRPSSMDAIDDAPDAIETMDALADASIDLADAAGDGSDDAPADVPITPDIVDAVADTGPPPCPMGLTRCGDACVVVAINPAHCGMCGTACPTRANAAPACVMGACRSVCNTGFADCDNDPANGCEAALESASSCGVCGTRCQGGTPLCQESAGAYRCVSGCSGAASTRCGMSCVDSQTDVQHCGMCDRTCPVPTNGRATCASGTCGIACNTGYHVCGTTCAPDTAVETCGTLCSPCPVRANATSTCSAGSCGFACTTGFADCDGDASNGCEVDTRTTVTHCGVCNRACATPANGRATCAAGSCGIACNAGFANCDGNATNGCETDLNAATTCGACDRACPVPSSGRATCSASVCGFACNTGFHACGTSCADDTAAASCGIRCSPCPARANASATCAAGSCGFACNAGFADCDGDASNGCESPLDAATSCGACGTRCQGSTPLCQESGGTYRCVSGCSGMAPTRCGASCVNPQADLQHCGACDNACAVPTNGRATCAAGTCGVACNTGYHVCGTTCADDTAVATCGTQCSPCPARANASARCTSGSCAFICNAGFADCDGNASNGCEVDTRTSTTNCGMCGRQCGPYNNADQACVNGSCAIAMCHGATGDCNVNIADGCEVLLTTNVTHCGRCGSACPSRANASATCATGTCGFTCNAGFADCDGDSTNGCEAALSNPSTCGRCGNVCPSRPNAVATCSGSMCATVCTAGFADCDGNAANGCEADTRRDSGNCGACGNICPATQICMTGSCGRPWRTAPVLPTSRGDSVCVWTGESVLVFGGERGGTVIGEGLRLDALTGSWRSMADSPLGTRRSAAAGQPTWTGTEWLIWGGYRVGQTLENTGARYTPATDTWTAIPTVNAPSARAEHASIWTGREMIVWGGTGSLISGTRVGDGGRYTLSTDTWTPISNTGAPSARAGHTAVWTGTEMLVWGGRGEMGADPVTGGRYDPVLDRWQTMSTVGAPSARFQHTAVWTGREMIVWGGGPRDGAGTNTGARYDPALDRWTPMSTADAPTPRAWHTAVWTGREMIVWGGFSDGIDSATATGGAYDPLADRWRPLPVDGTAPAAGRACAVWTGAEMIVIGGHQSQNGTSMQTRTGVGRYGTCELGPCVQQRGCAPTSTTGCGVEVISGGVFSLGVATDCIQAPNDPMCAYNAAPAVGGVVVGPFEMDRYEVSVARFRRFWTSRAADGGASTRSAPVRYPNGTTLSWSVTPQAPDTSAGCNWTETAGAREAHPMNCLDWGLAQEFCVWDGGRLPTEAEREYAARGRPVLSEGLLAGRIYPWGDIPPEGNSSRACDRAHINQCVGEDGALTRRIGSFASSGGLFDLAGNVWEWAADRYLEVSPRMSCWGSTTDPLCAAGGPTGRAARGGGYAHTGQYVSYIRGASRTDYRETDRGLTLGLRCVRPVP